jgi:uncharacterized membrane protein
LTPLNKTHVFRVTCSTLRYIKVHLNDLSFSKTLFSPLLTIITSSHLRSQMRKRLSDIGVDKINDKSEESEESKFAVR